MSSTPPDYGNGPSTPSNYPGTPPAQGQPAGYPPTQGHAGYPGAHNYPGGPGGPPQKDSKMPLIIAGAVVLLALLAAGVFLLSDSEDAPGDYAASTPAAAPAPAPAPVTAPDPATATASATPPPAPTATTPPPAPVAAAPPAPAPRGYMGSINITGNRRICHLYEQTSVARFRGMSVCYDVNFNQGTDGSISGSGIKTVEYMPDGSETYLPPAGQSPIRMTGAIDNNDLVSLSYTVQGASRATQGTATYSGRNQSEGDIIGSFRTDAANASGQARLTLYQ